MCNCSQMRFNVIILFLRKIRVHIKCILAPVDEKCEKDKVKLRSIVAENFEINEKIKYETLELDFLPWRYFSLIIKKTKKIILRIQHNSCIKSLCIKIRMMNNYSL